MPFSVRLDPEIEAIIEQLARTRGRSRASVVREAVAHYAVRTRDDRPLFARMEPHIGVATSAVTGVGRGRLSEDTGQAFVKMVRAKARARRAR